MTKVLSQRRLTISNKVKVETLIENAYNLAKGDWGWSEEEALEFSRSEHTKILCEVQCEELNRIWKELDKLKRKCNIALL